MNISCKLIDTYCGNCFKNTIEKNLTITNSKTQIEAQNGYLINVLYCDTLTCCIIIQNGENVIIRIIPFETETSILIPSNNSQILTFLITDNIS